jgi:N-carbamoylputrescine amidase
MSTLRVAAIQVSSLNGAIERNLANAEPFVAEAAARGARLLLCFEFLAAGYVYEESIWESGEPAGGATESWLARQARAHGVFIGASFLEAEGEHFHNTFSLFAPDGALVGRVRKHSLPFYEGWFFTPCSRPRILDTPLGRLAVGICNDNQTASFLREVLDHRPDLILMPHSAPTPELGPASALFRAAYERQLREVAPRFAAALGVPVLMTNKVSLEPSRTRLPLLPLVKVRWRFRGHSTICDADGQRLGYLEDAQGVLVADVEIDPARRRREPLPAPRGYWSFAPAFAPLAMGKLLLGFEAAGKRAYRRSRKRAEMARRIARS